MKQRSNFRRGLSGFLLICFFLVSCSQDSKDGSNDNQVNQAPQVVAQEEAKSEAIMETVEATRSSRAREEVALAPEMEKRMEELSDSSAAFADDGASFDEEEADYAGGEAPASAPGDVDKDGKEPKKKKKTETWKRSQVVPNTTRLMIGDNEELPLKGMEVQVQVEGFRARVLLDCYFYNDSGQQYEGNFQLRLPNEASPYFFAFGAEATQVKEGTPITISRSPERSSWGTEPEDIMTEREKSWIKPKEARMVPKEKAALAYTETVRRQVDPALMEWSGAGVFNARVFPLEAQKLHRIVIGYDVNLLTVGDEREFRLDLPAEIPSLGVDFAVKKIEGMSWELTPSSNRSERGEEFTYSYDNPDERSFLLRGQAENVFLTANDSETSPYFATRFRPSLGLEKSVVKGSSHGVFLVDTSLSMNPDRFNVWLKLLESILENNRDSMTHFAVLFFNVETFWWQESFVENTPENLKALKKYTRNLVLEGATDLGSALSGATRPVWVRDGSLSWDLFLLSDGAATWGESQPYALSKILTESGRGALFGYTTGLTGTNLDLLNHLTRESGGSVFSVVGEDEVKSASQAHRQRPWQIIDVQIEGTSDLLMAGRPQTLFPGQELLLVGRGTPASGSEIVLKLQRQGEKREFRVAGKESIESILVPRIYGQVAVGQLEEFSLVTEEYARPYATYFRVPGQTCSLLMLDTEEDYERFNIKPEEDAFVIKSKPVYPLIVQAIDELAGKLGDAKVVFMNWLSKMEQMPGVEFAIPTAFQLALEKMPSTSFAVESKALSCQEHTIQGIPGDVQEQLASLRLEYDSFVVEAERRLKEYGPSDALKALSSLVENKPGDGVLARDVGFSAMQWGLSSQAYYLFYRVASARPFEPQNYHALALCLEGLGKNDLALAYYEVGLHGKWASRYGDFRRILGLDYLRFLRQVKKKNPKSNLSDYIDAREKTLAQELSLSDSDLLITIFWNTDSTDIDLHVVEPGGFFSAGEECYYENPKTKIGGQLTQDVTTGYGPEMYTLPKAVKGDYKVRVNFYSSNNNRASARTKVYVTLYQKWGTPEEKITQQVVALDKEGEMYDVASVSVP